MKSKSERVYVFIDGSNLYHGIRENIGNGTAIPINLQKFSEGHWYVVQDSSINEHSLDSADQSG